MKNNAETRINNLLSTLLLFALLCGCPLYVFAWQKTLGGDEADGAFAVCRDAQGNYACVGYTASEGSGKTDVFVAKIDQAGNTIWTKSFGTSQRDCGNDICATQDGGFIITGFTVSTQSISKDLLLLKISGDGIEEWRTTFGGTADDEGKSIIETGDGGFIVSGCTASLGAGEFDVYIIKTDSLGNESWSKTYGGSESEWGNDIVEQEFGGYYIAGASGSYGSGNRDFYLVSIDENGIEEWNTTYGTANSYEWGSACTATSDGGVIIIGQGDIHNVDLFQIYVVKADSNGTLQWSKYIGESTFYEYGEAIVQRDDGTFQFCGSSRSISHQNDLYFGHLDASGNILSKSISGGTAIEWASDMLITEEGSPLLVGYTTATSNGKSDMLIERIE